MCSSFMKLMQLHLSLLWNRTMEFSLKGERENETFSRPSISFCFSFSILLDFFPTLFLFCCLSFLEEGRSSGGGAEEEEEEGGRGNDNSSFSSSSESTKQRSLEGVAREETQTSL
jgi:hypothetical protein